MFTHEICDVRPKQTVGVPWMQFLPPWPASPTTSLPLKNSTPRGLSNPAATSVGPPAADTGAGRTRPTAINRAAANDRRILRRTCTTST